MHTLVRDHELRRLSRSAMFADGLVLVARLNG